MARFGWIAFAATAVGGLSLAPDDAWVLDPVPALEQYRSETVPYNSKFTFTRIRYDTPYGSRRGGFRGYGGSA